MSKKTREFMVVGILLIILFFQGFTSIRDKVPTFDETAHIAMAISAWKTGDYRQFWVHPPLVNQIAGIPLAFMKLNFPIDNEAWEKGQYGLYPLGQALIWRNNTAAEKIILFARIPILVLSVFLGLLIYRWSKLLWGVPGALISLVLYCFSPNILAHSTLVTNDLGGTLFFTLACFAVWWYFTNPSSNRLILTGVCFGLAFAARLSSSLLLIPIFFVIFFLAVGERRWTLKEAAWKLLVIVSVGLMVFILDYGFKEFFPMYNYYRGMKWIIGETTLTGHPSYLMGNFSPYGWRHYFLIAFLVKSTIPVIILSILGLIVVAKKRPLNYCLLVPPILFFLIASFSKKQIGLRYILPVYPFLFIWAGAIWQEKWKYVRPRISRILVVALLIWHVVASLRIYPNYLAYFNPIAGGPDNGWRWLSDSNLDWGQDLKALAQYRAERPEAEFIVMYFGSAPVDYYIKDFHGLCNREELPLHPERELLAISATVLTSRYPGQKPEVLGLYDWLLKQRTPVDKINYSIFIYDITRDAETHRHLAALCRVWNQEGCAEREEKRARIIEETLLIPEVK